MNTTTTEARAQLTKAFAAMRKQGLIARQNFSCCLGCAGCELVNEVEVLPATRRAQIKGAVFYTKQQGFEPGKTGTYLFFGSIETTKVGTVGLDTKKVGKLAVQCLKEAGLTVKWNGSPKKSIWVAKE